MIEMRILNHSQAQIAAAFNVHPDTVAKTLKWAEKAGLIADVEDKILQELVPAAHKAIKTALEDGEHPQEAGKLGLAVFQGVVPGFGKAKPGPTKQSSEDSDDLATYINQLRQGDAEDSALKALPPAEAEIVEEGVDVTARPTPTDPQREA